jgi:O-antigen ligase
LKLVISVCVALLLSVGALWQGYFYETAYLPLLAMLWLCFGIVVMVYKSGKLSCIHIHIGLLVILYGISGLYGADREQALLETAKLSLLLPFAILFSWLPELRRMSLLRTLPWVGAGLTAAGILFHLERNGRLESYLEYANALAILLLADVLICLFFYIKESRKRDLLLLVVNGAGLLLTFSRSVWVLWLVSVVTLLFLIPEFRQRKPLIFAGLGHLSSWLLASAVKRDPFFFLQRVRSIQPEASELQIRLTYWRDSLGIVRNSWWRGTGGGGWSMLQHLYQSKAYYVKYVHNQYLQILLDAGIWGLLVWLGLLVSFYAAVGRVAFRAGGQDERRYWAKASLFLVSVMLLHAGFDFDLSFPLLFFILLGIMLTPESATPPFLTLRYRGARLGLGLISLCIAGFGSWFAVGYGEKAAGMNLVQAGKLQEARIHLKSAERILPWSHSTKYESAKGYVLSGNETGNLRDYEAARTELESALKLAPQDELYASLMNDLNCSLPGRMMT